MAARLEEMMAGLIKVMMMMMVLLVVMVEMMMAGLIKMKYLMSSQKMMIVGLGEGDIQNLNSKMIFPPGCPTASLCPLLSLQGRRLPWEGELMLFLRYLNNNYLGKVY